MNKANLSDTIATLPKVSKTTTPLDNYLDNLAEEVSLYQIPALKAVRLKDIYKTGYDFLSYGEYKKAIPFFKIFAIYNQGDSRGWMSLATCYQYLNGYQEATIPYLIAGVIAPNDPSPKFHLGQCWDSLDETEKALQAFQESLTLASKSPSSRKKYKALINQIKSFLETNS
jgi:type III secretion system low calcium response chaperone LcrH/SycD